MIFISAGHYPSHPGAKWERFIEHDEAVIWADAICEQLDNSMRVPTGVLKSKTTFINERVMNNDIAIEIHFNAARDSNDNPIGKGCETLYYPGSDTGKALASLCQAVLAPLFPPDRGIKEGWYRMDKSKGADFFLAKTKCPAVIIEPEFVHRSDIIEDKRVEAVLSLTEAFKEYDSE